MATKKNSKKASMIYPKPSQIDYWAELLKKGVERELLTDTEAKLCLKAGSMSKDLLAEIQSRADASKVPFAFYTWTLIKAQLEISE
jgi:hypothetical protein